MKRARGILLAMAALVLLGGCGKGGDAPSLPAGQPRAMTSVLYNEDAPDILLDSRTVTYTYLTDDAGRVIERRYALGGAEYREQTAYDAEGRAILVTSDRLADGQPAAGSTAQRTTYDAAGRRLIDETYAREGETETLTARTAYTYGEGARAESATVTGADGAVLYTAAFTYAAPADFISPAAPLTDYDYSAAALVEQTVVSAPDGATRQVSRCAYDAADRPLYRETVADAVSGWEDYTYDDAGRLLTHTAHRDGTVYRETYQYDEDAP